MDIKGAVNGVADSFSKTLSVSASPDASRQVSPEFSFQSQFSSHSKTGSGLRRMTTRAFEKQLKPFATGDMKILLLENINEVGQDILRKQGYQVEAMKTSLPEHELIEKVK